jgi:elongation factor P
LIKTNLLPQLQYLKANDVIPGTYFGEKLIGLKLPMKVTLTVKEAAPAVKGNTTSGATKRVVLENGLEVTTPLFIKEGDKVIVNTETNQYVERA